MLKNFGEELKAARDKTGITLEQIANKSRIDLKFLELMEKGEFSFLPELYMRAFIKEYASMVGIDVDKTLNRFERAKAGKLDEESDKSEHEIKIEEEEAAKSFESAEVSSSASPSPDETAEAGRKKLLTQVGIIAGVILAGIMVYLAFIKPSGPAIITEKPYEEVVKENKERYQERKPDKSEFTLSPLDSLTLTIFTKDTSWIKIILDDKKLIEFFLFPDSRKNISTHDNFKLTIGNSGSVELQLNGKLLPFQGSPRQVTHLHIDKNGLNILTASPTLENE